MVRAFRLSLALAIRIINSQANSNIEQIFAEVFRLATDEIIVLFITFWLRI